MAFKRSSLPVLFAMMLGIPLAAAQDLASPSAPAGRKLSYAVHPASTATRSSTPDSNSKSGAQPNFSSDCPVVQVNWAAPEVESKAARKPSFSDKDFSAQEVTDFQFEVPAPRAATTEAQPAPAVNSQVMSDLMSLLVKKNQNALPKEHYMSDLNGLVNRDQSWIKLHPNYAASHAQEVAKSEPTYLSELNQLSRKIDRFQHTSATSPQSSVPPESASDPTVVSAVASNMVPLQPVQDLAPARDIDALFTRISNVKVNAVLSGSEPVAPESLPTVSELQLEDSTGKLVDSGEFFGKNTPAYYQTPLRLSVSRPNRQLQPFHHNPLYFEDPNLERCGVHSDCLTNACSIGHFAFNTAILPYRIAAQPPCTCVCSLGDCPTCYEYDSSAYLPPFSWAGVAAEAGVITGLVFIIP